MPSLFQLIDDLNNYEPKNKNLKTFKQDLETQLRYRFKGIFLNVEDPATLDDNDTDYSLFIATFLDPFFKNEYIENLEISEDNRLRFINKVKRQLLVEFKNIKNLVQHEILPNETLMTNNNESQIVDTASGGSYRRPLSTISNESDVSILISPKTKRRKFFNFFSASRAAWGHRMKSVVNMDLKFGLRILFLPLIVIY